MTGSRERGAGGRSHVTGAEAYVVDTTGLSKQYGKDVAVDHIDLQLSKGELFGLIGPDGAGKTSIFHMLGGILDPSSGTLSVLGTSARMARRYTGYVTQKFSLYPDLTVDQNLHYAARLQDITTEDFDKRREYYLDLMDLKRFSARPAGNLSGGMKQKLALCCALMGRPQLLLLDEPTTGVDPVSRRDFWDVLASISAEGVTIAVATPYLDEAERCSRIALIHKGTILESGTPSMLKEQMGLQRLELRGAQVPVVETLIRTKPELKNVIIDAQEFGDRVDVLVKDLAAAHRIFTLVATEERISLEISEQQPTLENVFAMTISKSQSVEEQADYPFADNEKYTGDAIAGTNLCRNFGDFRAVDNVSISVSYGEIYGLLGANGAGKTTIIKMLCGLLEPTSGDIALAGRTGNFQDPRLRRRLGYMSQKFTLYEDLTVLENLRFYGGIYQVPGELMNERINWALETCNLSGNEGSLTRELPGGFRQRLAFAASVLHQPQILFLDEPTSGVDPIARRQLWSMIGGFARRGAAVLITTHFLEEAEYCHQLGFIAAGQLVASGTPNQIKESQPGMLVEVRTNRNQQALDLLHTLLPHWRASIFGDALHIATEGEAQEKSLIDRLRQASINVEAVRAIPFTLEDAFIGIAERSKESNGR